MKKLSKISNEIFNKYLNDKDLQQKIRSIIYKGKYWLYFDADEIKECVYLGIMKGIGYYRDGFNKKIQSNIIDFVNKEFINLFRRDKRNCNRKRDEKIYWKKRREIDEESQIIEEIDFKSFHPHYKIVKDCLTYNYKISPTMKSNGITKERFEEIKRDLMVYFKI